MCDDKQAAAKLDFLFEVLRRYDAYIGTTNFKIGLMLSFLAAIVLGLLSQAVPVSTSNSDPAQSSNVVITLLTLATILIASLSAFFLMRAVSPNTKEASQKSLIFFGDVANHPAGSRGYWSDVKESTLQTLASDAAYQTHVVAGITQKKMTYIKWAASLIAYGVLPMLAITISWHLIEG